MCGKDKQKERKEEDERVRFVRDGGWIRGVKVGRLETEGERQIWSSGDLLVHGMPFGMTANWQEIAEHPDPA